MRKVDNVLAFGVNGVPAVHHAAPEGGVEPMPQEMSAACPSGPVAVPGLRSLLEQFVAMPGVRLAALFDREGFLIESAGGSGLEREVVWALASSLAEYSNELGRELDYEGLHAMILEYDGGTVLLQSVGSAATIGIVLGDAMALREVRDSVKKVLPDLIRMI